MIGILTAVLVVSVGLVVSGEEKENAKKRKGKNEPEMVSLATILDSKPSNREYNPRNMCISLRAIRSQEVLNKRLMVFTMRGREKAKYLVQFGKTCFGLHKESFISVESMGSMRLCTGDNVRTSSWEFGRRALGPACIIPSFQKVSDYQVELLKEAILTGRVE